MSDNCISRLVTALGGGTISVTLYAVVLQPRGPLQLASRSSRIVIIWPGFNRKGGTRGRFREIGVGHLDFKCFKREKIGCLIRVTVMKLEH